MRVSKDEGEKEDRGKKSIELRITILTVLVHLPCISRALLLSHSHSGGSVRISCKNTIRRKTQFRLLGNCLALAAILLVHVIYSDKEERLEEKSPSFLCVYLSCSGLSACRFLHGSFPSLCHPAWHEYLNFDTLYFIWREIHYQLPEMLSKNIPLLMMHEYLIQYITRWLVSTRDAVISV